MSIAQQGGRNSTRCAIRTSRPAERDRVLVDYLARHAIDGVCEFAPHDDDELDEKVQAGHFDRVVFSDIEALLECAWKGYLPYRQWRDAGATIDLATLPAGGPENLQAWLEAICEAVAGVRKHERRRQTIGALILSIVALAAMAALFFASSLAR